MENRILTILRDSADCLTAFIHADLEFRARRIVQVYGKKRNPLSKGCGIRISAGLPATGFTPT